MTKTTRRKFLTTAAAAITGALLSGIVEAEQPVPVEDIQAVPLGRRSMLVYSHRGMRALMGCARDLSFGGYLVTLDTVDDISCGCAACRSVKQQLLNWERDA